MTTPHDSGYKLLFAHPELVGDLLRGFVAGEWIAGADFSTLEHVNGSYVSDKAQQRHEDMVWRLRVRDRWLWVYLALEFQSEPDPWMALRMMAYVALLAQTLVRQGGLHGGQLPPILPVVLYNGLPEWRQPVDVGGCFVAPPPGLENFQPRLHYHLVDEARLKLHPATEVRNFAEAVFAMDRLKTVTGVVAVFKTLHPMLISEELQPLRRSINIWVKSLLRRKAPGSTMQEIDQIKDLMEPETMLAETIDGWWDAATEKGVKKGLQEGMQKGMQQGMQQGRQEGMLLGEARILVRLLTRRFGDLPSWVEHRLADASPSKLEGWSDAVLTAGTLEEVFAMPTVDG